MNLGKKDKVLINGNAAQAAQHCCCKTCYFSYNCGKNKQLQFPPMLLFGANQECPLTKYNVPLWEPNDFFDKRGEKTEEDLF